MTENAQLALIGVLGAFLTGVVSVLSIYLNILLARIQAAKVQAEVATQTADVAVSTAKKSAEQLGQQIEDNTAKTESIHKIVNGRQDTMLARIAELEKENAALKAAQREGNSP